MSIALNSTPNRLELAADVWLSGEEAALYCGVHIQTIRKAARLRELAHPRKGQYGLRCKKSALDAWMKRGEVPVRRLVRG